MVGTGSIANFKDYSTYIQKLSGDTTLPDKTKEKLIQQYSLLLNQFAYNNSQGLFITRPTQGGTIVSEGQSYWMLISSELARINPDNAANYQRDFDLILKGTDHMIGLAKAAGNPGEFPAWQVERAGDRVVLSKDQYGPTANSASDADLDMIRGLIFAQDLVNQGIWKDQGYGARALKFIQHAQDSLFKSVNGTSVMKPSEDWDGFSFTDYLAPASCMDIARFLEQNKQPSDFWKKAAHDSMLVYKQVLKGTGEFPAQINVTPGSPIAAQANGGTHQTYDGIRSPWRIADYIIENTESAEEKQTAADALTAGEKSGFSYTSSAAMDASQYLPLAIAMGDSAAVKELLASATLGSVNSYFEGTLLLLGTITALYPRTISIEPTPATSTPAATVVSPLSSSPIKTATAKPVKLASSVVSGWGKAGLYSTAGNTLTVKGTGGADADSIALGAIDCTGAKRLILTITDIKGSFPWGKVFGLAMDKTSIERWDVANKGTFPNPQGYSISDNFIDRIFRKGDKIIYDIPPGTTTLFLGMKPFVQADCSYTIDFTLEQN